MRSVDQKGEERSTFYAHSANRNGDRETVGDHLKAVADLAAEFAKPLGIEQEARIAALLHDLGKYSVLFARRLEGIERGLDHWSIGAWAALTKYRAIAAALSIQGHHVGLKEANRDALRDLDPRLLSERHPESLRLTATNEDTLLSLLQRDGLRSTAVENFVYPSIASTVSAMLDVRMLFSVLVDADWLETEAHFEAGPGERKRRRPAGALLRPQESLEILLKAINDRACELRATGSTDETILRMRAQLLDNCLQKARSPAGLFTLSAPTGSGKTLSMLAFGLAHAAAHSLRKVVVVIPYLSIIEQTANTYRDLFQEKMGEHFVLEHHSLSGVHGDPAGGGNGDNTDAGPEFARRLSENWDAPLIVTTSVQMLESLFADRPAACRKLHRLARSVILFDEVQTLPLALSVPTLKALAHLSESYGSSIVFATATQPAFEELDGEVRKEVTTGWRPAEIVSDVAGMFSSAKRTRVVFEAEGPSSWQELADRLHCSPQALCIVNLKRHASRLLELIRAEGVDGLFHLSTNLCPAHREQVLKAVRGRLERREPCRLVATQCIEAGVDVDFPVVYRSLGPLDAIAQAAGRCNRNGKLSLADVHVFMPEDDEKRAYPSGAYEQATDVLSSLLREHGLSWLDINDPGCFAAFYRKLYSLRRP